MTTPDDFRAFAMDCLHWADTAADASQEQILRDIGRLYMRRSLEMDDLVMLSDGESPVMDDLRLKLD